MLIFQVILRIQTLFLFCILFFFFFIQRKNNDSNRLLECRTVIYWREIFKLYVVVFIDVRSLYQIPLDNFMLYDHIWCFDVLLHSACAFTVLNVSNFISISIFISVYFSVIIYISILRLTVFSNCTSISISLFLSISLYI